MEAITNLTSAFMNLFYEGGEQFTSWVAGIIPLILMLLVFMNSLVAFIGQERVNRFAKFCTGNPLLRYLVLPFVSALMLGNPMALSMGKFLPEFYKPAYYAAASYHYS